MCIIIVFMHALFNFYYRNLRHSNILHFLGYAKDDKQLAILTNLVDGEDLYKILFEKNVKV